MAHDVFICYSGKDKLVADAACAKLEENGIRCWIAPRDPIAGIPYGRQLVEAIEASKAVLLIFSENANGSDHVLREIELAADRSRTIIPLRTDGVLPKGDLEYFIRRVHWLDAMSPPLEGRLDELVILVRRILTMGASETERLRDPATVPRAQPAAGIERARAAPSRRNRALPLVLVALAVVFVAGIGTFIATGSGKAPQQAAPLATGGVVAATSASTTVEGTDAAAPPAIGASPVSDNTPAAGGVQEAPSAAASSGCATYVNDANPPLNVRDAPSGTIVAKLPDKTKLTVDSSNNGWSHITAPVVGWVFSTLTKIQCP